MSDQVRTETAPEAEGERPSRFGPRPRPDGDGERRGGRRFGGGRFGSRRKVCAFCMDGIKEVDYKDMQHLRRHLSERGKIEPPPQDRSLREASALIDGCHQAGPARRPAAVRRWSRSLTGPHS